jgi:hypothetical protein
MTPATPPRPDFNIHRDIPQDQVYAELLPRPLAQGGGFLAVWQTNLGNTSDGSGWGIAQTIIGTEGSFARGPDLLVVSDVTSFTLSESEVNAGGAPLLAGAPIGVAATTAAGFDGGELSISLDLLNLDTRYQPASSHSLSVIDQGSGTGQIGLTGTDVSYEGTVIGTLVQTTPDALTVSLNANADNEAVEALFKALGYSNPENGQFPAMAFEISLTDAAGRSWQARLDGTVTDEPEAGAETPVPGETQVNQLASDDQYSPEMARLADGGWVVVWQDDSTGGTTDDIRATIYNADGTVRAPDVLVNAATAGHQLEPEVTAWGSGFAVAWRDQTGNGVDNSQSHVKIAGFDADGTKTVAERQLNDYTPDYQYLPTMTTLANGNVVVAWESRGQDGSGDGIYGKILSAADLTTEVLGETRLSTTTAGYQDNPSLAADLDGGFALTYQSESVDGSGYAVMARGFNADGSEAWAERQINTYTSSNQDDPFVAALVGPDLGSGPTHAGYVVVWRSNGQDGSGTGIYFQMLNPDGTPNGAEQLVNGNRDGNQYQPVVAALSDGGFVVGWYDEDYQDDYFFTRTIDIQRYDANGDPLDGEETVSLPTSNSGDTAQRPEILALDNGDFVVAWDSNYTGAEEGPDTSGYAVHQRIFGDAADYADLTIEGGQLRNPDLSEFDGPSVSTAAAQAAPVPVDTALRFDADGVTDFDGWTLHAAVDGGLDFESLAIASTGTSAGEISVSGSEVFYEGTKIGDIQAPATAAPKPFTVQYFNSDVVFSSLDQFNFDAEPDFIEGRDAIDFGSTGGAFFPGGDVDFFGVRATGRIWIDAAGDYTFYVNSDDGARLFIDGAPVIDRDALGGAEVSATQTLTAGYHDIRLDYFDYNSTARLILEWEVAGSGTRVNTSVAPGATGASPLEVVLNANATPDAIETLAEALTYSLDPSTGEGLGPRAIAIDLSDTNDTSRASESARLQVNDTAVPELRLNNIDEQRPLTDAEAAGQVHIAPEALFEAVSNAGLDGGFVTVTHAYGNTDYTNRPYGLLDLLSIENQGTGAGQIGIDGDGVTVTYEGTAIGTITADGTNGGNLEIALGAGADEDAVQALIRAVTWENQGDTEGGQPDLTIQVTDGGGLASNAVFVDFDIAVTDETVAPYNDVQQVNSTTDRSQSGAVTAQLSDGRFVAVWHSYAQDNPPYDDYGVYGRIYDADGSPVSTEFLVSDTDHVRGQEYAQDVVALDNGRFAVGYYNDEEVELRIFGADGLPEGDAIRINTLTSSTQDQLKMTALPDGSIFATWRSWNSDGNSYGVAGRMFDGTGTPITDEFDVNLEIASNQEQPMPVTLNNGDVMVVWRSETSGTAAGDGSSGSIQSRVFQTSGTIPQAGPSGDPTEITVNTATEGNQHQPQATVLNNGNIVITWTNDAGHGWGSDVRAKIVAPDGTVIAEEFILNDSDYSTDYVPIVRALTDGGFVAAWRSYEPSGNYEINLKTYAADGTATSDEFGITEGIGGTQYLWDVVALDNGAFAVSWRTDTASAGDGSEQTSQMQIFGDPTGGGAPSADPQVLAEIVETLDEAAVNAGPQALFAALDLTDADSADFDGGAFSIGVTKLYSEADQFGPADDARQDVFSLASTPGGITVTGTEVFFDGTKIGDITQDGQNGAQLSVSFTAGATRAAVEAMLEAVRYANGSDDPEATRRVEAVLSDGDGGSTGPIAWDLTITPEVDSDLQAQGDERRVNTFTAGEQAESHVAALADGGYVVVWRSVNQDDLNGSYGVFGQRFDASGTPVDSEFQVNTVAASGQYNPMVSSLDNGGWVVLFRDDSSPDGSAEAVQARVYDAAGVAQGDPFVVHDFSSSTQYHPAVAQVPGGFVAAWASWQQDGNRYATVTAVFDNAGNRISAEQVVNQDTVHDQFLPRIASFDDGGYVIAYATYHSGNWQIEARVYDAVDGSITDPVTSLPATDAVPVNITTTSGTQYNPDVATFDDGRFIVVWEDHSSNDGRYHGVFAQILNRDGTPASEEFLVNEVTWDYQQDPKVTVLADGRFIVTWYDDETTETNGSDRRSIQAQLFDTDGNRIDGPFQVNAEGTYTQSQPEVAALAGGGVAFVWTDSGEDGSGDSVETRVFAPGAPGAQAPVPVVAALTSGVTLDEQEVNAGFVTLDVDVSLIAPHVTDFDGGSVLLQRLTGEDNIDAFLAPDDQTQDQLGVVSTGTGPGEISVSGASVSFSGVEIGTISATLDGVDGTPLKIELNANATRAAVEALIEALGYANTSEDPLEQRSLGLVVNDGAGGISEPQQIDVTVTPVRDLPADGGPEQRANSVTADEQRFSDVAVLRNAPGDAAEGYVVAWRSVEPGQPGGQQRRHLPAAL